MVLKLFSENEKQEILIIIEPEVVTSNYVY